jgi:hypothetical protein
MQSILSLFGEGITKGKPTIGAILIKGHLTGMGLADLEKVFGHID